jgi:hypothetical protein
MPARPPKRAPNAKAATREPPRFAPSAFLKGSPEQVRQLCDDLATLAAERFSDLTGTSWRSVGETLASQLRALGHDLIGVEEADEQQEWVATWHHPRGTFSLVLSFQAPYAVAVSWKADDGSYTARR